MKNLQNNNWIPVHLRGTQLYFRNGIPAVEFVNELLNWIDSTKLGDKRKTKYKHFITYYAVACMCNEDGTYPKISNKLCGGFDSFWNYVKWVSNKIKKPIPENIRNRFLAHSL